MTKPRYAHGKVCYLIILSEDPQASARFFEAVFDWNIRTDDNGTVSFDDSVGQVSGMWMPDRQAVETPGSEIHIMVANADETERSIVASGGTLVWRAGPDEPEVYGTFHDPSGNLFGYYQQPGLQDQ